MSETKERAQYEKAMVNATADIYDALMEIRDSNKKMVDVGWLNGRVTTGSTKLTRALRTIIETDPPDGEP